MQVTETLSDGLKRAFTVVVPAADLEQRRTSRLAELGKTARVPGFRPGKVPLSVMRQRYGAAVTADVLETSVDEAAQKVLDERGLRAAMQPKIDVQHTGDAKDLEFSLEVELLPEIALPDFAAIELTRLKAEPSAEAIDRALGEIAERQADARETDPPRAAAKGDVVIVDYTGKIDGTPFPGGTGADTRVEVGGPGFIPGFSEQLEGLSAGDQRTISVTFPAEYPQAKELEGKPAAFEISVKSVMEKVVPPVDEALAENLGLESLERLRSLITQRIQREYDQFSRMRLKRQLLDALAGRVEFSLPPGLVESEFHSIWARLEADRKAGQIDSDDAGKDDETLKSEYRAIAERRVRLGLLLAEVGRLNSITVAPDELNRAIRAEAARYPGQEQRILDLYRQHPPLSDSLRGPIFEDKVVDFVVELAKVTDQTVTAEELLAEPAGESAGQTPGEPE